MYFVGTSMILCLNNKNDIDFGNIVLNVSQKYKQTNSTNWILTTFTADVT